MKQREANFELLRILAAFMFVSFHMLRQFDLSDSTLLTHSFTRIIYIYISTLGSTADHIFFLLAGYFGIKHESSPAKVFKIWRIFLFYTIFSIAFMTPLMNHTRPSSKSLLLMFFPVTGGGHWFVAAYIVIIMMSPTVNKFLHSIPVRYIFTVVIGLICLYQFFVILFTLNGMSPDTIVNRTNAVPVYLLTYCLGAALRIRMIQNRRRVTLLLFFASAAVSLFCVYAILYDRTIFKHMELFNYHSAIFCLILATALFLLFSQISINSLKISMAINAVSWTVLEIALFHGINNSLFATFVIPHLPSEELKIAAVFPGAIVNISICVAVAFLRRGIATRATYFIKHKYINFKVKS